MFVIPIDVKRRELRGCPIARALFNSFVVVCAFAQMTFQCDAIGSETLADRVVLRRLSRAEYENTMHDLLAIDVDLRKILPPDQLAHGFDKTGDALHTSSFLMERYLDAAEVALNAAIANGERPRSGTTRYSYKQESRIRFDSRAFEGKHRLYRDVDEAIVFFSATSGPVVLRQFSPPMRGKYRCRISAYGFQSGGTPVTYIVRVGVMAGERNYVVRCFDAPADRPSVSEFVATLEPGDFISIAPCGVGDEKIVRRVGADMYPGAGLAVEWVEVEGPLYDCWPPESHRRIFGDLPRVPVLMPSRGNVLEVQSNSPIPDAQRILHKFARRAFRRTVTDDDIEPFLSLIEEKVAEGYSFEQAVRVGLKGVLVSPKFLFLNATPGTLDDFALGSRLSYFLWNTMPDEELLSLAEQGSRPVSLRTQVERMLNNPKAGAFTEDFVAQWLNIREIDATVPDWRLYPEFDEMLKLAMVMEATLFFEEVLKGDLDLSSFVASDFTMINGRLARHYGIPGIEGSAFRKITLPPGSHRGGVLTMASVLKVTANGTSTSPVLRGAWLLDRILGKPSPPPPDGVLAIEPDIRGAITIRQQLAKHRDIGACASCHAKIDPLGMALESFDVIGGWRENYRILGGGEPLSVNGRRLSYHFGSKVDPSDVLCDGRRFDDIDAFKQLLLEDKDQLARALTEKLLTYATGRPPDSADHTEVEAIIRRIRNKNYGFRSLIHEIVQSRIFQQK